MNFEDYILGILLAFCIIGIAMLLTEPNKCESCMLYNIKVEDGINGIYKGDYYCVWTKDRTPEEINKTDVHEYCHHLVHTNYYHFCEEPYETTNKPV